MTAPTFRKLIKSIDNDEKIVPLLRTALWDPNFKSFTIKVDGFSKRKPDGWFHPSTHPLWTEPMLYLYMSNPESLIREPFDPASTMAVTAGSFFHDFVQTVLLQEKVLERHPNCPCGLRKHSDAEVLLVDEEVRSRGHSDGVTFDGDGFEFKTMNTMKMGRIPKGRPDDPEVLAWFVDRCPDYYAQAQEYLRMSKRLRMVVVILSLTYPFEMREIHVPFDPGFAFAVRDKFARVIQAVADQRRPRCECGLRNTTCPARGVCHFDN